jgi:hypothetical protein
MVIILGDTWGLEPVLRGVALSGELPSAVK